MKKKPSKRPALKPDASGVVLLSGGNPQIGKGDGDAVVEHYLSAVPGWKQGVCRRLDALVVETVPGVQKAVRWNTPFYGVSGNGWFLGYHCFDRYVKVTFLNGGSLVPMPPLASKLPGVRSAHVHEGESMDEALWAQWLRQASALPGDRCF